jgi:hypothetical protein
MRNAAPPRLTTQHHSCCQALALEVGEQRQDASHASLEGASMAGEAGAPDSTFYEVTIATVDQPKLLSRLSDAMVRGSVAAHATFSRAGGGAQLCSLTPHRRSQQLVPARVGGGFARLDCPA